MKHKGLLLYTWFIRLFLGWLPDIPFIMRFRGALYSLGMPACGKNFQVSSNAIIRNLENCYFGDNVYLAPFVVVNAIDRVTLNNGVMIGFSSVLVSGNHTLQHGSFRYGKSDTKPISVLEGAWVGANCTLTAGSVLPQSSLLAANSALTKEMTEDNYIYGGVPAKPITAIKSSST
ncbi:hypothetical protein [Pseudoalteromonas sp. McH1-42]|uniref:acyltransferase n=1 Tax=Pseudoalteromonas sp. McH1-42 TaxID=2917752 RepID=UPI001EF6F855|nr:hypothetical protein [Pseudoalteromonas sp. McH1-42]MCG7562524.1 hypothetical protein [Pseudoalteromonas sp. McH1-42]